MSDPSPFQHHSASVGGVKLHWLEIGSSHTVPPLILLHGLGGSSQMWKRTAPFLAEERRVLIPDLPGHGLSERLEAGYQLSWYAQLISRWIHSLGLRKVDVVGHSFGGGVAQMLLLEDSIRIRRLILAASGGLGKDIGFWLRLASIPYVVEKFGQPFMGLGTRLTLSRLKKVLTREELDELIAMNEIQGSARAFSRTVRDVINWRGQTRNFLDRAHEIKSLPPIAVIWGDCDALIPHSHGEALRKSVEGVTFIKLKGCGHFLQQENPQAFAREVRAFIEAEALPAARLRMA